MMQGFNCCVQHATLILMVAFSSIVLATEADDAEDTDEAWELSFEIQLEGEQRRQITLGEEADDEERELGVEFTASLLYPITPRFMLFAEAIALINSQWTAADRDWQSDESLERGELWLRWQPNLAQNFSLKLGRQEFTESRQWWWDEDLDALGLDYEAHPWSWSLALAKESAPRSTLEDDIHPADDDVVRALGHMSWQWMPNQSLDLFALYQNDRSATPMVDDVVTQDDEVDANLSWLGLRAIGDLEFDGYGSLAYWLDSAWVWGNERILEFEEEDDGLLVTDRSRRDVRGWALDVGVVWELPVTSQPQLLLGYAFGSGDTDPGKGKDRTFRQTGLQGDDNPFLNYGELFNPELSNLHVVKMGVGWPLSEDSLLALVHHRYRQVEAADFLRESDIDRDPEGIDKDLGWAWDLVFQHEIEDSLSLEVSGSMFEAGRAFGVADGERAYRLYFEVDYEF